MATDAGGGRRAAVLGSPISHSLSPALHRAAYTALGLDWRYDAIDVSAGELSEFLAGLDGSWRGLSLTMPLKEEACELGESTVDITPLAAAVRSVNTLVADGPGRWLGENTDVPGIVRALHEKGFVDGPGTAIVVGSGATARSAIAACARMGLQGVHIMARRLSAAAELGSVIEAFGMAPLAPLALPTDAGPSPDEAWRDQVLAARLWCSTLPADAAEPLARVLARLPLDEPSLVDATYHPWPAPMARAWPGPVIASGRDMLLWQAVEQVRLMTGQRPPVDRMRAALESA